MDYVIAVEIAIITTVLVVLSVVISRYSRLVKESTRSNQLAKDLWDAMSQRLLNMDSRIVDLMARVDVYSVRSGSVTDYSARVVGQEGGVQASVVKRLVETKRDVLGEESDPQSAVGEELHKQILQVLSQGPRTSGQIREVIGRSREHTARLMKGLFDSGFVVRDAKSKPYLYELTENGRSYLRGN